MNMMNVVDLGSFGIHGIPWGTVPLSCPSLDKRELVTLFPTSAP
jgi:hypothetical protein